MTKKRIIIFIIFFTPIIHIYGQMELYVNTGYAIGSHKVPTGISYLSGNSKKDVTLNPNEGFSYGLGFTYYFYPRFDTNIEMLRTSSLASPPNSNSQIAFSNYIVSIIPNYNLAVFGSQKHQFFFKVGAGVSMYINSTIDYNTASVEDLNGTKLGDFSIKYATSVGAVGNIALQHVIKETYFYSIGMRVYSTQYKYSSGNIPSIVDSNELRNISGVRLDLMNIKLGVIF